MTPDQLLAFLLFALVAAVTPGPSNIILTSTGATVGVIRGLPCLFGASLGMGSIVCAVGVGVGSIVLGNALLLTAVKWGGIAFLLWLSWQIATSRHEMLPRCPGSRVLAGRRAAMGQPQGLGGQRQRRRHLPPGRRRERPRPIGGVRFTLILAALPSGLLWLALGSSVQRRLRTDRSWTTFNRAMAALLAASIVLFIW